MEQYIFSLFWLCLFINAIVNNHNDQGVMFFAAAGSLITSVTLLPLVVKQKRLKEYIRKLLTLCLVFVLLLIVFGQFSIIIDSIKSTSTLFSQYAGTSIPFIDRLKQYLNFIASCFLYPNSGPNLTDEAHPSWQLQSSSSVNLVGIVILLISILGAAFNYKDRFTQICLGWVLFSFLLLCVLGLGTAENGLILYSLYFFWAFLSLVFIAISKVVKRTPKLMIAFFTSIIIFLLALNIPAVLEVIKFGITYYPV
jgi:hypothetical protein